MDIGIRTWIGVAIGCGTAMLLVYLNRRDLPAPPQPVPETRAEEAAPPPQVSADEPAPMLTGAVPSSAASAPPVRSTAATPQDARPPCTNDAQCKGPRHAPCIESKCINGQCVYDESHCECVSSEDCDDGDPCTRNHCFSSTQKCIYIPIDDCKK